MTWIVIDVLILVMEMGSVSGGRLSERIVGREESCYENDFVTSNETVTLTEISFVFFLYLCSSAEPSTLSQRNSKVL